MDNSGKLLEAWIAMCSICGETILLNWDNGTHMSKSQAIKMLTDENGHSWVERDNKWICNECYTEMTEMED